MCVQQLKSCSIHVPPCTCFGQLLAGRAEQHQITGQAGQVRQPRRVLWNVFLSSTCTVL